jgi:hypothetical protein
MKTNSLRISITVAAFTLVCNLQAQHALDWFKIAGGGGTVSGNGYSLSGTVGQPDAGSLSGGNFSFTGGFWSIVESSGAPPLSITFNSQFSTVRISWPLPAAGFVLDQSTTLLSPPAVSSWAPESSSPDLRATL